ncbi:MAG: ChaN family lipoprotein [Desulfobacteraceae bacterium]|nr:ChaN family lipoprotein [Desulfobacteraceae bacterium]
MIRIYLILAVCLLLPMIQSCATTVKTSVKHDPLVGKILETSSGEMVSFSALMHDIMDHDVIYLSEKHDNPMHHAIQHRIIQHLVETGRSPALGFEFFAVHDTPLLLNFVDSGNHLHGKKYDAMIETHLRRQLDWERQSDRMWKYYFDLLTRAKDNRLMAVGLDLPGSLKRRITRKGMADITDFEKTLIFSTDLDNPAYAKHMKTIFAEVHCGMGDDAMRNRLYDTWKARNDTMARSITRLANQTTGPVVVIIGNGHTEYGLGVVDRVRHLNAGLSQVNLALTEIRHAGNHGLYLSPLDLDGFEPVPPADYIWFTQRVSDEDPCRAFREKRKQMKSATD